MFFYQSVFKTYVILKNIILDCFNRESALQVNKRMIIVFSHILNIKRICTYEINFVLKSKCCLLIIC